MIIITAGSKYVDIDVLACAIAYRDLCKLSSEKSAIHLTGPFNSTITSEMRTWSKGHINQDAPIINESIQYVIVDVSHPDYLKSFVTLNQVIEV